MPETAADLVAYLVGRGADREKYWAEKPVPVVAAVEEPAAAKKAPPKKGKKGAAPEPEPEPVPEAPPPAQFGLPDPNNGPTQASWKALLDVPSFSYLNSLSAATPLCAASATGDTALAARLLSCGASPNCPAGDGLTPLMLCAAQGNAAAAEALIEAGADMDAIGPNGANALKFSFCVPPDGGLLATAEAVLKPEREEPKGAENKTPKIVVAGAPASGKGTQCEEIVKHFGVVHLSTGDMLRAEVEAMTDVGLQAKSFQEQGEMVPDDVIIAMVEDRIKQEDCLEKGWLLDGFPRTPAQAAALEQMENGKADTFVLLDVDDGLLVDRVVGRRRDPETGKIYHLTTNPPETEEIAARLEQRSDDNEETVKVRLANYHSNIDPVAGIYDGSFVYVRER